jgi:hypothetical protein
MDAFRNDAANLTPEQEQRVLAELGPGESLVWIGQPRPDLMARGSCVLVGMGVFFLVFSVIWIGATLFMSNQFAAQAGAVGAISMLFSACGLPFVAVGIFMLSAPVWMRNRARRTIYALTDRRAIVWEAGWFGSTMTRSYTRAALGNLSRDERADGAGDLIFQEFVTLSTNSDGYRTSQLNRRGFLGINHVREVEQLVRQTLLGG